MKKFFIFFIIMVSILTFTLTRSRKIDETKVVSEKEVIEYKKSLEINCAKYGFDFTEEEINNQVENYKQTQISMAKSKGKGLEIGQALKISVIVSAVSCAGLFLLVSLTKTHYRQLYKNPYASSSELYKEKLQRDFFEKNKDFFNK